MLHSGLSKFLLTALSVGLMSGTASATCVAGQPCNLTISDTQSHIVPFSAPENLSVSNLSPHTVPGLGPNERLCPTTCPVDVYNPKGGKVLGCYNICKPVAPAVQTHSQTPVQRLPRVNRRVEHVVQFDPYIPPAPQPTYVRVVHPVIYVRYPVPVAVPHPVCRRVVTGRC